MKNIFYRIQFLILIQYAIMQDEMQYKLQRENAKLKKLNNTLELKLAKTEKIKEKLLKTQINRNNELNTLNEIIEDFMKNSRKNKFDGAEVLKII